MGTKRKNSPSHSSFFPSALCVLQAVADAGSMSHKLRHLAGNSHINIAMIRKNSLFCKLIRIKSSSKVLFDAFMSSFRPELEICPCCGSKGNCRIHAYYGRKIVDFRDGRPVESEIVILRLACGCGHTHAILPDFIIPYSGYGLFFILRVLAEHFMGHSSVERLCERFSITRNQFYKWLTLWHSQKAEWLGALQDMGISSRTFMHSLLQMGSYSGFASSFVRRFARSFFQSHKNPAGYCQQVF